MKMTPEIIEGNKLIAEFMEQPLTSEEITFSTRKIAIKDRFFKYHTSWDWLMPSWGKLSSELLSKGRFDIIEEFKNSVVKNDISEAHKIVVKGINIINE